MSRSGDQRSELATMRYFTPELVLRLNSQDSRIIDAAMEQWEKAIASYKKKLQKIERQIPAHSRRIAELSFHDWSVLGVLSSPHSADAGKSALPAYVVLNHNDEFVILCYLLTDKLERVESPMDWHLSKERIHWLYDELEVNGKGDLSFIHKVLLSDGTILLIPFSSCQVMPLKLSHVMSRSDLMQVA